MERTANVSAYRNEICERFDAGEAAEHLAREYNCSRQYIYLLVKKRKEAEGGTSKKRGRPRGGRTAYFHSCPYPNLKAWLEEGRIGISQLTKEVFGSYTTDTSRKIRRMIDGTRTTLTIHNIRKLEEATGMAFDEIFFQEGNGQSGSGEEKND